MRVSVSVFGNAGRRWSSRVAAVCVAVGCSPEALVTGDDSASDAGSGPAAGATSGGATGGAGSAGIGGSAATAGGMGASPNGGVATGGANGGGVPGGGFATGGSATGGSAGDGIGGVGGASGGRMGGASGSGAAGAGGSGTSGAGGSAGAAPTFTELWNRTLENGCAVPYCHDGSGRGWSGFDKATAHRTLVGAASTTCPGETRVVPGDPEHSVLAAAISHTDLGACDVPPMPRDRAKLSQADIDRIVQWIRAGARND